ncbi:MAG: hypothetical protein ACPL4N_01225, partial [Candidatus Norongarragalinales archaeon]
GQGLSEVLNRYPELVFNFTDVSPPVTCGKQNNVVTCSDLTPLKTMINWNNVGCKDPNQVPCYYLLDALTVRSLIIDETPAFRVSMSSPNAYNWGMYLKATGVNVP